MECVKIFGIERSGTNFLEKLCELNIKNVSIFLPEEFGWKHAPPKSMVDLLRWNNRPASRYSKKIVLRKLNARQAIIHPMIVIKNPYSWYWSIRRRKLNKFNLERDYKRYNFLYGTYKKVHEGAYSLDDMYSKGFVFRYEDLLLDAPRQLRKATQFLDLELKDQIEIPKKVYGTKDWDESRAEFYLKSEDYDLPLDVIKTINNVIDWNLMKYYGYTKIRRSV